MHEKRERKNITRNGKSLQKRGREERERESNTKKIRGVVALLWLTGCSEKLRNEEKCGKNEGGKKYSRQTRSLFLVESGTSSITTITITTTAAASAAAARAHDRGFFPLIISLRHEYFKATLAFQLSAALL